MILRADWLYPGAVRQVLAALAGGGHQGWLVGGCVRNALIGAAATDIDIATDARPDRVTALMEAAELRVVPTGIDHGTVTVVAGGTGYEVTTFRRDVATDGRRAVVAFSSSLAEDAARRDFTMNALYADADGALADPLGGLPDLLARRVRFIGDPAARICEDYLRILRFFRFHAWYGDPGHGIDADGLAACADHLDGIESLSRERIGAEMLKLLAAPDPGPAMAAMAACGALARVLPGASAQALPILVHLEDGADPIARLAALGGEGTADALRLSRAQAARLDRLRAAVASEMGAAELGYRLGLVDGTAVLRLRAAATGAPMDPIALEQCLMGATRTLPVTAADLMPALQGPALGAALRRIERRWIDGGMTATRDELLSDISIFGGDKGRGVV